ncbi:MAG: efflux RND transporter permease subunit [Lachnospiraceae bacterium]|nr:efflux RND transporter permease subunit [Lachnospiraceae bacterium]
MLAKFSVRKPYTVLVGIVLILLLGFISLTRMSTDLLPSMNMPYAVIITTNIGSTPEEIEKLITAPIEGSMASMTNIKNITSESHDNYSMVVLEFYQSANMDSITVDMREKLNNLKDTFPENTGNPTIMKINPDMLPVLISAVSVEGMDIEELTEYVNNTVVPEVESVEGVGSVTVSGGVTTTIEVTLNKEKCEEKVSDIKALLPPYIPFDLDLYTVFDEETLSNIIKAQNLSMPAGYVSREGQKVMVRVGDELNGIEDVKALPVLDLKIPGVPVITLDDIADVEYRDNSDEGYTSINKTAGIILTIDKQTGYSTGDVTKAAIKRLNDLSEEKEGLSAITVMDQGVYIKFIVDSIVKNMLYGGILAIIILFIFLRDLKPTLVVACSIPVSVIAAVVLMYFSGVTLNAISLSGLSLGVGMLVDNSIVVMENIYRLRSKGHSIEDAAVEGTKQVIGAIVASTLTTACVFLPIVFTEGITRQLFVDMGLTIAYSLLASLVIAMTFVPMMSKVAMKNLKEKNHGLSDKLRDIYAKVLAKAIRYKAVVFILALAILGLSAWGALLNGTAFMPEMESTQMSATLIPDKEDITVAEIAELSDEAIERIMKIDGIEAVGANYGAASVSSILTMGQGDDGVSMYIIVSENKEMKNAELAAKIEEVCADLPCTMKVQSSVMDISSYIASGLKINIKGRDVDMLTDLAAKVRDIVSKTEGTVDVKSDIDEMSPGILIRVDKEKAIGLNMTVGQVYAIILSHMTDSTAATTVYTDTSSYDVYIKSADKTKPVAEELGNITFTSPVGNGEDTYYEYKISDIAEIIETDTLTKISREGQKRYLEVSAGIDEDHNIGLVSNKISDKIKEIDVPAGYEIEMAGEDYAINDAIRQLLLMMAIAVAFIYLIMVAQFQSLKSPFIIMFTIPLAITGGFLGLFITGMEVSVISILGFIILAGVIANNGIVLVDYTNKLIEGGMKRCDAIVEAGRTRLRPILMTALTTIFAMSTMAIGVGMGAEMSQPMAVVTIGGLTYGTLLTLFVVPCLYDLFNRKYE